MKNHPQMFDTLAKLQKLSSTALKVQSAQKQKGTRFIALGIHNVVPVMVAVIVESYVHCRQGAAIWWVDWLNSHRQRKMAPK